MAKILPVHNSSRALIYLHSQLEFGGSLFKQVGAVLDSGCLYVIVPDSSPDDVQDLALERGFVLGGNRNVQGVCPTDAALELFESLHGGADWLVVADAHHLAAEDPVVRRSALQVRTFESDVYFIGSMTKGRDYVRSLILRGSSAWYGAAMLVGPRVAQSLTGRDRWGKDDLSILASDMRALLVRAYDHQGYVLWLSPECDASGLNRAPTVREVNSTP